MDRIHVLLRDNAFNMKAGICMLKSSTAFCFIHTLQLIFKDSLFLENNISVLIAKVRQTVGHLNNFSTAAVLDLFFVFCPFLEGNYQIYSQYSKYGLIFNKKY